MEIERKFLVQACPDDLARRPSVFLRQGYLAAGPGGEARLRDSGRVCVLTVKGGVGLARAEHEVAISRTQFDELWPATEGRRIEKRRYSIKAGAHTYHLDLYAGGLAGLMTVEVEFRTIDDALAFDRPPWFGCEVTKDERYRNSVLALRGSPCGDNAR